MKATKPKHQAKRLQAIEEFHFLNTELEKSYDDVTALALQIYGAPIAVLTLADDERQWVKSRVALSDNHAPRAFASWAGSILKQETAVVPDAFRHDQFAEHRFVTGAPYFRFYAGVQLRDSTGMTFGSLCVIDRKPRQISDLQKGSLEALARVVTQNLKHRRLLQALVDDLENEKTLQGMLQICAYCKVIRDGSGDWRDVETYISERSDIEFSHGVCPSCMERQSNDARRR